MIFTTKLTHYPLPCPECGRTMNPRGRSEPLELACLRDPCPADDPKVNPRHLWDANDSERWRFYPDEEPASTTGDFGAVPDFVSGVVQP